MIPAFWAYAPPQLEMEDLAKRGYLYGTPAAGGCPDVGFVIDCDLRSSSKGNLLLLVNGSNAPVTRTVNISGCAVAGQPTLRRTVDPLGGITLAVIPAGTTTDTPTLPAAGGVDYICSNNEAAEYSPPVMSVGLADVANATQVLGALRCHTIRTSNGLANVVNLGTGSGTVPWYGGSTMYFQYLYLKADGSIAAQGGVQTQ